MVGLSNDWWEQYGKKRLFSLWDKARSDLRRVNGIKLNHYSLWGLDYNFRLPVRILVLSVLAN